MIAKLRIDISQGILEVEGSEEFVSRIYDDFRERLAQVNPYDAKKKEPEILEDVNVTPTQQQKAKAKNSSENKSKGRRKLPQPKVVGGLDLSGLKAFYSEHNASNNYERNLLFVYYLEVNLGISSISRDHIYSCYRNLNIRPPSSTNALVVSLSETSSRFGWLNTASQDDIKLELQGRNRVEYDLKKTASE